MMILSAVLLLMSCVGFLAISSMALMMSDCQAFAMVFPPGGPLPKEGGGGNGAPTKGGGGCGMYAWTDDAAIKAAWDIWPDQYASAYSCSNWGKSAVCARPCIKACRLVYEALFILRENSNTLTVWS